MSRSPLCYLNTTTDASANMGKFTGGLNLSGLF